MTFNYYETSGADSGTEKARLTIKWWTQSTTGQHIEGKALDNEQNIRVVMYKCR